MSVMIQRYLVASDVAQHGWETLKAQPRPSKLHEKLDCLGLERDAQQRNIDTCSQQTVNWNGRHAKIGDTNVFLRLPTDHLPIVKQCKGPSPLTQKG